MLKMHVDRTCKVGGKGDFYQFETRYNIQECVYFPCMISILQKIYLH